MIEVEGVKKNEDALYSIRFRQPLIVRAISTYLKKYVQISEFDPLLFESELLIPGHQPSPNARKNSLKLKPSSDIL